MDKMINFGKKKAFWTNLQKFYFHCKNKNSEHKF